MLMLRSTICGLAVSAVFTAINPGEAASPPLYANDFQTAEVGKVPDGMLVLGGDFIVTEESGARVLELPGAPLETFGVLFGPAFTNNVVVSARIHGTRRGRLFPAFGVGLGGVNGYKLRVSPGKRELELHRADDDLLSVPFEWQSGAWTHFVLRLRQVGEGEWKVEGKAWTDGTPEPASWQISYEDKIPLRPGRAAIWGAPYASTPIRYDDLRLEALDPAK